MKTFRSILFSSLCMMFLFSSCQNDIDNDLESKVGELNAEAKTKALFDDPLVADTLDLGEPIFLEFTDEQKEIAEKMKQIPKPKASAFSYIDDDEDQYFVSNMLMLCNNDWPFKLRARGGGNTGSRYLRTNGKRREVYMSYYTDNIQNSFYMKKYAPVYGLDYVLYSSETNTPLIVGHWSKNPDRKMLMPMDNGDVTSYASWDIKSTNYSGYYVFENNGYLGWSDIDKYWTYFNYVLQVNDNNVLGYGKYNKNASQEFAIEPKGLFKIYEIEWDKESAKFEEIPNKKVKIQASDVNDSWGPTSKNVKFTSDRYEESSFNQRKSIEFQTDSYKFGRPTVIAKKLVLPDPETTPKDIYYIPNRTSTIRKDLSFVKRIDVPERCLIEAKTEIPCYRMEVKYVAKARLYNMDIKFSGTWRGTVYISPKISEPEISTRFFDLDTGEEIIMYSRSLRNKRSK